jgi:hypothetical protein
MSRGSLAGIGAALLIVGAVLFLAGAFVWTNNARHGAISPAVYGGPCLSVVGLALLIAAGLGAGRKR